MKKTTHLDEMQEQKLLHIEHNMAWLAFWGLFASLLIHILFLGTEGIRYLLGEWAVFMSMCIYMLVECLRQGIWDRNSRAEDTKKNLLLCLTICTAFSAVMAVVVYRNTGTLAAAAITFLFFLVVLMLACWAALSVTIRIYKRRLEKLENLSDSE